MAAKPSMTKRCRTYEEGCFICDPWHFYDTHKRFPTWHELMDEGVMK